MSRVLHRQLQESLPIAVKGEGPYIIDSTGRRYLDASGGAAVSCLGHSHAGVIRAIEEQLERIPFAYSGFFTSEAAEALADTLIGKAPAGIGGVFYVSGGSEAAEAAIKLARQYFLEIGQPDRRHFIARRQSYHGNTLGALATGGNMARRQIYQPLLMATTHIAPCYAYRDRRPEEGEEEYGLRVADELEAAIQSLGPGTVAAFIAEPVVGATLGAVGAVPGYFRRIRDICARHGVLLILDEVMCGMGRCGTMFACEQDGISADMITVAKGLGAGYQPIGALLVGERILEALRKGSGAVQHGHTYMAHTTACAAALAVQRAIEEEGLLGNISRQGAHLAAALVERLGNGAHIGDIRGKGLFHGVELVADRTSKEPFDPELKLHLRIKREAMARGLICYPMGGTIDGRRGDHVLVAPPYIVTRSHIDEAVDKLAAAIEAALASIGR